MRRCSGDAHRLIRACDDLTEVGHIGSGREAGRLTPELSCVGKGGSQRQPVGSIQEDRVTRGPGESVVKGHRRGEAQRVTRQRWLGEVEVKHSVKGDSAPPLAEDGSDAVGLSCGGHSNKKLQNENNSLVRRKAET